MLKKQFLSMMMVGALALGGLVGCSGSGTTPAAGDGAITQKQLKILSSQLSATSTQVNQLTMADYQTQINALVAGKSELQKRVNDAVNKSVSDKAASDAALAIFQSEFAGSLNDVKEGKISVADLQKKMDELKLTAATTAALSQVDSKLNSAITASGFTSAQIADLKDKFEGVISAADNNASISAGNTADITAIKDKLTTIVANAGISNDQVAALIVTINKITAETIANQAKVSADMADLEARLTTSINTNKNDINAIQSDLTKAVADVTSLKSGLATVQTLVASIISNYATQGDVATLQAQAAAIADNVTSNTSKIADLSKQLSDLQFQVAALQAAGGGDVTALTSQVATLANTVNVTVMNTINDLVARMGNVENNIQAINAILQALGYIQLPANSTQATATTVVVNDTQADVQVHLGVWAAGKTATFTLVQHYGSPTNATLAASSATTDINGDVSVSVVNMTPNVEYIIVVSVGQTSIGKALTKDSLISMAPLGPGKVLGKRLLVRPVPAVTPVSKTTSDSKTTAAMVTSSVSVTISTATPVWSKTITLPTHDYVFGTVASSALGTFTLTDIWNGAGTSYQLESRNAGTGVVNWAVTTPRYDWVTANDTELYVGGPMGVSRINPTNGAIMWTTFVPFNNAAGVAVTGGIVMNGLAPSDLDNGYQAGVVRLDASGNFAWRKPLAFDASLPWSPRRIAVSDGIYTVLVNQANNKVVLRKLDISTGATVWSTPSISVTGGYTVSADSTGAYLFFQDGVMLDNGNSGNRIYHYTSSGVNDISRTLPPNLFPDEFTPLTAANGCIYFVHNSYKIYKLDITLGNDKFLTPLGDAGGVITSLDIYGIQLNYSTGTNVGRYDNI